eukprot:2953947-Prymnesium_polylepis.2
MEIQTFRCHTGHAFQLFLWPPPGSPAARPADLGAAASASSRKTSRARGCPSARHEADPPAHQGSSRPPAHHAPGPAAAAGPGA